MKRAAKLLNRELSWLEFNQRVLDEARDTSVPLLERLKFLAITGSNLDEFFRIRVGGLQLLAQQGRTRPDPSGMTPRAQLEAISRRVHAMYADQYACLLQEILAPLASAGIRAIPLEGRSDDQAEHLERVFEGELCSVYTPMIVTGAEDFPLLVSGSLNLCVRIKDGESPGKDRYAVVPLGRPARRFIALPAESGHAFAPLESVVAHFADRFFPGSEIAECVPFRITRNADLGVREDLASDLLEEMEHVLDARKEAHCVRLEIATGATKTIRSFLQKCLRVPDQDLYEAPGPLDLSAFMSLATIRGYPQFGYEPWPPQPSPDVDPRVSLFDLLKRRDVLLLHPFESFEPVMQFLEEAAVDPDVLAIKQTLYRTSAESRIVAALGKAAENGKQVTALVELRARFDEARNIEWARNLERAGVQVIYGVKGLKTHAKILLVVRREAHGIQRYAHFGTGNYNEVTARLYTDVGLLTSHPDFVADATAFFNGVCGYSQIRDFRRIDAAPFTFKEKILELIRGETERKRQGQEARILAKLNSLTDPEVIDALYDASRAGVSIDLVVRAICALRPGVPGQSETIRVVAIVDRFLEHSRIFHFHHGGDGLVYVSSGDWMQRNLRKRVELLVPVEDPAARRRLLHVLEVCMEDRAKGRIIRPDGTYDPPQGGKKARGSQETLYLEASAAAKQAEKFQLKVLEPHRAPGQSAS